MMGVQRDVKLSKAGLMSSHGREFVGRLEQVEKALRVGWQREIRARPRTAWVKTEEVLTVKPVEIPQCEMALAARDASLHGRLRELLQEQLDFRRAELANCS